MATHFVYRSPYFPQHKFYKPQSELTVLEWFQSLWKLKTTDYDQYDATIEAKLGTRVYGLHNYLLENIYLDEVSMPTNFIELINCLEEFSYVTEIIISSTHLIQILTDDDEVDMAYYVFDDTYLQRNPQKITYLIQDHFPREAQQLERRFFAEFYPKTIFANLQPDNSVYLAFFSIWGNNSLFRLPDTQNGVIKIEGIDLSTLPSFLANWQPQKSLDAYPLELLFLRAQAIKKGELLSLEECLECITKLPVAIAEQDKVFDVETLFEQDIDQINQNLENTIKQSFDQQYLDKCVSNSSYALDAHCAAVSLYFTEILNQPTYEYWLIFDNVWATAHPMLANSIINFAKGWRLD